MNENTKLINIINILVWKTQYFSTFRKNKIFPKTDLRTNEKPAMQSALKYEQSSQNLFDFDNNIQIYPVLNINFKNNWF
jgi:hypothetical protein